jgi:hypothetical protein
MAVRLCLSLPPIVVIPMLYDEELQKTIDEYSRWQQPLTLEQEALLAHLNKKLLAEKPPPDFHVKHDNSARLRIARDAELQRQRIEAALSPAQRVLQPTIQQELSDSIKKALKVEVPKKATISWNELLWKFEEAREPRLKLLRGKK